MIDTLCQDLRYGLRTLAKSPEFSAVAVLTLALGIGANTAIFTHVKAMLFRPLPILDPDRIVFLWTTNPSRDSNRNVVSAPDFNQWRHQNKSFEDLAALFETTHNLTGTAEPVRVSCSRVSPSFFQLLGIQAAVGRAFRHEEDKPHANRVVVLSHGLWQRRFGAAPGIIGQTIQLDNESYTVIGIMPATFQLLGQSDLWAPLVLDECHADSGRRFLWVIGRLRPGIAFTQARAEMDTIARQLAQDHPETNAGWGVNLVPLREEIFSGPAKVVLSLLLGAVSLVLLVACANVANLQLARSATRQREIAIRAALGARRVRLVRQLLMESLLLSLLGGAFGVLLALWGRDLLRARYSGSIPLLDQVKIDGVTLGLTLLLCLLTAVIFGLVPALQASKPNLHRSLKEGGRSLTGGGTRQSLRNALIISEVALALPLLICTGLMIRTLIAFRTMPLGFSPRNLLTMRMSLPENQYPTDPLVSAFYRQVLGRLAALPGVQAVGVINRLPTQGSKSNPNRSISIEGSLALIISERPWAVDLTASPSYFDAMEIPLIKGRRLLDQDSAETQPVAVISETMAQRYWHNEDPVGKRIKLEGLNPHNPWISIVGVVGDVRNDDVDAPPLPQIYLPHAQNPEQAMSLAVRTVANPLDMVAAVRTAIGSVDRNQAIFDIKTMEQILFEDLAGVQLLVELLGVFAGLAFALASVGIYGVISYSVSQRTHEIGIRMALGAYQSDVLGLIVGQGVALVLAGVGIGVVVALGLTRFLASLLYRVSPTDPATFATISLLLTAVSLLASYFPARRAARVDPMVALRYE